MIGLLFNARPSQVARFAVPACLLSITVMAPLSVYAATQTTAHRKPAQIVQSVPGIKSIALFPTTNQAGANGAVAASALDTALKLRLNATGVYQATTFNPHLPSIQRALSESAGGAGSLSNSDIQTPVTESSSALRIARVMDTDGYMLDEIDAYREDPATHAVSVTVSGSLYYTSSGIAARTFAVTGNAVPLTRDEGAAAVTQRAVNSAATQIVLTFGVSPAPVTSQIPNSDLQRGHDSRSVLLIALAGLMVGVIAHNVSGHGGSPNPGNTTIGTGSSSSGSSGGSSGPPPPPL